MKKVTLLIAMAALVMLAGCKKENEATGTTVKASIEQNRSGNSKTSLVPVSGTEAEIHWAEGDRIRVGNGTSSEIFTLTAGADSKTGTFTFEGDYAFGASNVAVYPETAMIDGNTVSLNIDAVQSLAEADSFGNGANPMLGTFTDPESLTFTSLCGVLGLSLTGDDVAITGIEIVSRTATDKLNGAFEADCTATNLVLTPATGNSGTNREMLTCTTTLTATAKSFYIVLPVGTLSDGFTMNVYNGGTEPIFSTGTDNDISIVLNEINMMPTMEVTIPAEHEYVDLGLPSGLLWATCNVGADTPEGYGDYFAWGETTPKDYYGWSTYQHCMGSDYTLTKYCQDPSYGYDGFTDILTTLEPSDDAATANWGDGWRMPTQPEFQELLHNTTRIWTTQNGVNGRLFTAANGNSIFLPAAGYRNESSLVDAGSGGIYWSNSLYTDRYAWCSVNYVIEAGRCYGFTVRPVREP